MMNNSQYNRMPNEFGEDDDGLITKDVKKTPTKDTNENKSGSISLVTTIKSKITRPMLVVMAVIIFIIILIIIAAIASNGGSPPSGCVPGIDSVELKIEDSLVRVPCEESIPDQPTIAKETNQESIPDQPTIAKETNTWIVMQRRGQFEFKENFYRSFAEYEKGFGKVDGEYWMGLRNIASLTGDGSWELRVDITDWNKQKYFSRYNSFHVGPGPTYTLHVEGYDKKSNGGDSLTNPKNPEWGHNGMAFTTYDNDKDSSSRYNCAILKKGAWWYNECYQSNLNGINYSVKRYSHSGITWEFGGARGDGLYTVKEATMKIRKK